MKKYKVLIACLKRSDKKYYEVNDEIELTPEEAAVLIQEGRVSELETKPKKAK